MIDYVQRRPAQIFISVSEQELILHEDDKPLRKYPVSTAALGTGFEEGSLQTPTGRFRIRERFGRGARVRTVFRGRKPIWPWSSGFLPGPLIDLLGLWTYHQNRGHDLVTTRILWLDGLDPENANTYERYIYIHGTNDEERIGKPASHGCIRMLHLDVVDLFNRVEVGTLVEIEL